MGLHGLVRRTALAAGATVLLASGSAQAFTGVGVGDPVGGVLSSLDISVNSFARCSFASLSGTIATDAGAGSGGTISVSSLTLSSCTAGSVVTANALPSTISIDGAGNLSWPGMDLTGRNGSVVCAYRGTPTGSYNQLNGVFALTGGPLTRYSGIAICGATTTISGSFMLSSGGAPITL